MVEKGDIIYYYADSFDTGYNKGTIIEIEERYYLVEDFLTGLRRVPKCLLITDNTAEYKYEIGCLRKEIKELRKEFYEYKIAMGTVKEYAHEHSLFGYKYVARR